MRLKNIGVIWKFVIVFNMFNVTGKSQKVRYEYHFLNVRQVTRYICRKFEISHGGGAWGGSTYILMYLDVKIQKYCFSERKFSFRRNELLQCAPPCAPPCRVMNFSHILCYTYLTLKKLYSYHIFWLL